MVCGFGVVMAIFEPMMVFMSVDFPTFERPMITTNPDFIVINGSSKVVK